MANFINPFANSTDILGDIKKAQNELQGKIKNKNNVTVGNTPDCDFSSIQEAIDVVNEGCVINIKNGIYTETLAVNKKLSFIGEEKEGVIVQQLQNVTCKVFKDSIFKNIVFKNTDTLKITSSEEALVICEANAYFENCDFLNSCTSGLFIENEIQIALKTCKVWNINSIGIYVTNNSSLSIDNCEISETGDDCLVINNKSAIYIINSKLHNTRNGHGIKCVASRITADSCEIWNTKRAGIMCKDEGSAMTLSNCKIHDIKDFGIIYISPIKSSISNCEIYQTDEDGISCSKGILSMSECKIHDIKKNINNTQLVLAPIAGTVCRYLVKEGSTVSPDTKILTIECMKMELELKAGYSGKVHFITPIGSKIKKDQPLAEIRHEDLKKKSTKNSIPNNALKNNNGTKIDKKQANVKIQKNKSLLQNSIDNFYESDFIWGLYFCCPIFIVIYAGIIFWEYLKVYEYFCIVFCFFMIGMICGVLMDKFLNWKSTRIIKKNSNNDSIMDWIVFFIFCIIRIAIGGVFELILWLFLDSSLPIDNNILWIIFPGMAYSGLFILLEIIHIIYYKINKNPKLFNIIILAIINVIIIIGIVKSQNNNFSSISHNNEKLPYILVGKNEEIKTLKKAIKLIDEGGTIELRPGTYSGNITKNIKVIGIKDDIRTKSSSELPIIKGQCKIKANAEIEGVAFSTNDWDCLLVESDSRIKNISILDSYHDGIVFTAKNATLENAIISNCRNYGIRYRGNAKPTIINTRINRTTQAGIYIEDNANPTLTNCIISNNKAYGLVIKNTASGNFSNCINNSGYSGIVIKSPVQSVFLSCNIFNNGGNGVKISNGSQLKMGATSRFENCKIHHNKSGILIYNKANPILQDCVIYSNKEYGIWIKNNVDNLYSSCSIDDNIIQNIYMDHN